MPSSSVLVLTSRLLVLTGSLVLMSACAEASTLAMRTVGFEDGIVSLSCPNLPYSCGGALASLMRPFTHAASLVGR